MFYCAIDVSVTCCDQEKSKLDWDGFKHEEGISEELTTHNRGKDGYVNYKYVITMMMSLRGTCYKPRLHSLSEKPLVVYLISCGRRLAAAKVWS